MNGGKRLSKAGLRRAVRALALELADALVEMVDEQGLWDEAAPEPKEALAGARVRRSPDDLASLMGRILTTLRRFPEPVAIGAVARELGTSSRQITHPMALLVERGEVRRSGERRGARYELAKRRRRAPTRGPSRGGKKSR